MKINLDTVNEPDVVASFSIDLVNQEEIIVQPGGTITVHIPFDDDGCKVMWVQDDGTKTDMGAEYKDGCYVFTTNHLSIYQLVKSASEPSDGSDVSEEPSDIDSSEPTDNSKPDSVPDDSQSSTPNDSQSSTPNDSQTGMPNNSEPENNGNSDTNVPVTGENVPIMLMLVVMAASCGIAFAVSKKRKHN